jgi:hypothetical protein
LDRSDGLTTSTNGTREQIGARSLRIIGQLLRMVTLIASTVLDAIMIV